MRKLAILTVSLTFSGMSLPAMAADMDNELGADARPVSECGVTFYKKRDLHGLSLTRRGPETIRDTDDVHYADGDDLDNDVRSVGTHANTLIEIYSRERLRKLKYTLPPNTWRNVSDVESYRITCRDVVEDRMSYKDDKYDGDDNVPEYAPRPRRR